jgi:hypothetical protein
MLHNEYDQNGSLKKLFMRLKGLGDKINRPFSGKMHWVSLKPANILYLMVLWRIDPLLSNGAVNTFPLINNATVGLQQWKSCFLRGPCREVISEARFGA